MVIENQEDLLSCPASDPSHPANRSVCLQYKILKETMTEDTGQKFQVDIISRDFPELGGLAPMTHYLEDVKD